MPLAPPLAHSMYKLRWPDSEHAIYVTINDIEQDGVRRPFEVFVNSKNLEHYAWVVALTRMISAVFRRGGEVAFVAEELKQVFDPRGGQWSNGRYVPSLVAAIGDILERHMIETGSLSRPESQGEHRPARRPKREHRHPCRPTLSEMQPAGPCHGSVLPGCRHCGWSNADIRPTWRCTRRGPARRPSCPGAGKPGGVRRAAVRGVRRALSVVRLRVSAHGRGRRRLGFGTHRHEVERKVNRVSRMAPAPSEPHEPARASALPQTADERLQLSFFERRRDLRIECRQRTVPLAPPPPQGCGALRTPVLRTPLPRRSEAVGGRGVG